MAFSWCPDVLSDGLERADTAASLGPFLGGRAETTRPSLSALGAWGPRRAPVARGSGEPRRPSGTGSDDPEPSPAPSALTEGVTPSPQVAVGDPARKASPSVSALSEGEGGSVVPGLLSGTGPELAKEKASARPVGQIETTLMPRNDQAKLASPSLSALTEEGIGLPPDQGSPALGAPSSVSALRRRPATRVGALPGSPAVCDDDPPDLGDTKAGRHLSARETRLLTKAVCNTRTRCWEWRGWKVGGPSGGYGQIKDNGKGRRAHRVAYETFVGEIPEGLQVLHHCDNPPCINPEHLYLGTPADNGRDMAVRGRRAKRLSDQDVVRIREEKAQGRSLRELADKYGVSHRHIWDVASGRKRKYVKLPPAGSVRAW